MKKLALLSLSLLMLASAVQPAFGMQGEARIIADIPENPNPQEGIPLEQQRRLEYQAARNDAKWAGAKTGFYSGIFSGLGLGSWRNSEKIKPEAGFASLIGAHMLSTYAWQHGKKSLNEKIKNKGFSQTERKDIRKNFHRNEFLSHVATTAAVITTVDACINKNEVYINSNPVSPFLSFWVKFSGIFVGTYIWKSFTYGITR